MHEHELVIEHADDSFLEDYALGLLEARVGCLQYHLRACDQCLLRLAQVAHFLWIVRQVLKEPEYGDVSSVQEEISSLRPERLTKPLIN